RPDAGVTGADSTDARRAEDDHRDDEIVIEGPWRQPQRSESGAATAAAAGSTIFRPRFQTAWSCSTRSTRFRRSRPTISPSADTQGGPRADRAPPKDAPPPGCCASPV